MFSFIFFDDGGRVWKFCQDFLKILSKFSMLVDFYRPLVLPKNENCRDISSILISKIFVSLLKNNSSKFFSIREISLLIIFKIYLPDRDCTNIFPCFQQGFLFLVNSAKFFWNFPKLLLKFFQDIHRYIQFYWIFSKIFVLAYFFELFRNIS